MVAKEAKEAKEAFKGAGPGLHRGEAQSSQRIRWKASVEAQEGGGKQAPIGRLAFPGMKAEEAREKPSGVPRTRRVRGEGARMCYTRGPACSDAHGSVRKRTVRAAEIPFTLLPSATYDGLRLAVYCQLNVNRAQEACLRKTGLLVVAGKPAQQDGGQARQSNALR